MNTNAADTSRFNPVFWLMWLLPGSAVLAGFTTLAIALKDADRALPAEYHWEGERLDADFARARAAAGLGIEVTLDIRDGQCLASLRNLPTRPKAINLLLTHGSDASLDRRVRLPLRAAGEYRVACAPLESGKWRVAVDDDSARWAVRANADGPLTNLLLRARDPVGAIR
jgi:hypothetical protein